MRLKVVSWASHLKNFANKKTFQNIISQEGYGSSGGIVKIESWQSLSLVVHYIFLIFIVGRNSQEVFRNLAEETRDMEEAA